MNALLRPVRHWSANLGAAAARVLIAFGLLTLVWDATARLAVQLAPAGFWFTFERVTILPSGTVTMVYRQSLRGDLPMSGIVELLGPGGEQPCSASNRRVIEAGTTYAAAPVRSILPDCRWAALPDGDYVLQLTLSYLATGDVAKTVTVRSSNAIQVRAGHIAGATPLPAGGNDGARP